MTTLTQKAQVTIPKQFRVVLGLRPGDEVDFEMERGKLVLRKKARKLPFEKWRGYLKGIDSKKIMEELRG